MFSNTTERRLFYTLALVTSVIGGNSFRVPDRQQNLPENKEQKTPPIKLGEKDQELGSPSFDTLWDRELKLPPITDADSRALQEQDQAGF